MKWTFAIVVFAQLCFAALAQQTGEERRSVPGRYLVGLYADERGSSNALELEGDQVKFDAWIGISGDSTRVFSAVVFRLAVPRGLRIDGPIKWRAINGLSEVGVVTDPGVQVEFNVECMRQLGPAPVILGHIPFVVDRKDFESGSIEVLRHDRYGLSVELCLPDKDWPKPFCDPIHLQVTRKRSFWQRVKDMFG